MAQYAKGKISALADKFGQISDDIVEKGLKGQRFWDLYNNGNINVFSPRPDGKNGYIRITLDPKGERIISSRRKSKQNCLEKRLKSR